MLQLPVTAVPSQTLSVTLDKQNCQISIYQKADALYFDLLRDGSPIVLTRICRNNIRLLLDARYYGFIGDFVVVDTQGDTQPEYSELGTRYVLLYLTATDLA